MIKLKGHETFAIREGWLSKGLIEVDKNEKVFSKNFGADTLGVGSNMAKAIRYWLKAGSFTKETGKSQVSLTEIGKIILKNDRYFEDIFPLEIFHINLVYNRENATSWYLTFNKINAEEFDKDELFVLLENAIHKMGVEDFSVRSLQDDVNVLLNMYTREKTQDYDPEEKRISPFSKIGLMKKNGKKYIKTAPDYTVLSPMAVLYALKKYMDYKNTLSLRIDEAVNEPLSPGKVFNLKRIKMNEYLDKLEEEGYITLNRTAGLDMIYMENDITLEQIMEKYYA